MNQAQTVKILIFPDKSWVWEDEYDDVCDTWRGDDYYPMMVAAGTTEEEIYSLINCEEK